MPFTKSSRAGREGPSRRGPRRRSLLTGVAGTAGAALLTGCTDGADTSGKRPKAAAQARARAARDSAELIARYDAVLAAHPSLAERLRPLRTAAARHVESFGGEPPERGGASASPNTGRATASPAALSSPAADASPGPAVPADEKDALAQLAAAERQLADARRTALLDLPGEDARLFASVAAAGDAHAYLLSEESR